MEWNSAGYIVVNAVTCGSSTFHRCHRKRDQLPRRSHEVRYHALSIRKNWRLNLSCLVYTKEKTKEKILARKDFMAKELNVERLEAGRRPEMVYEI